MTKQEKMADIRSRFGQKRGVVSVNEVAEYMGVNRKTAARVYLRGLSCTTSGRGKWYEISDVAERLLEMRREALG